MTGAAKQSRCACDEMPPGAFYEDSLPQTANDRFEALVSEPPVPAFGR